MGIGAHDAGFDKVGRQRGEVTAFPAPQGAELLGRLPVRPE
ncbi:hypothetical protein [Streptomyces sp. NPDC052107]